MRRWIFHIPAAISLLLALATTAMWVRSAHIGDQFRWTKGAGPQGRRGEIASGRGMMIYRQDTAADAFVFAGYAGAPGRGYETGDLDYILHALDSYGSAVTVRFLSGSTWASPSIRGTAAANLFIPDWLLLLLLLCCVLPIEWMIHPTRKSVKSWGLCSGCGYHLRATPDRCRECGRTPRSKAARA